MSYDHIRHVAAAFHGTIAERMVLTAFATHVNPTTSYSAVSVAGVAKFCHLQPSHVRRIVRKLEGAVDAQHSEPGKWLYPLNRQARQGDGQATCYRMFLDSYTAPARRRAATNPTGINFAGVGGSKPRSGEPTRHVPGTYPPGGFQEPTGRFPISATSVPQTSGRRFQEPTKAMKSIESPAGRVSGDQIKAMWAELKTGRKTGPEQYPTGHAATLPDPLPDSQTIGGQAPKPPPSQAGEGMQCESRFGQGDTYPDGWRQTDIINDLIEPTIIPELQA